MEDLKNLIMLEHTKEAVKKDLQSDGCSLGSVQNQAGDVKHDVRLHYLYLQHAELVHGTVAEFFKS